MGQATSQHDVVDTARRLVPHIRAKRDELETARRVPPSLVQAIAGQDCFNSTSRARWVAQSCHR
jgi:hypothetical protein